MDQSPCYGMAVAKYAVMHARMLILFSVVTGALGLMCPQALAERRPKHVAEWLQAAPIHRITLTRYNGHPDFFSQRSLVWQKESEGTHFRSLRTLREVIVDPHTCEALLDTQQKFPLYKLLRMGVIQPDQLEQLLAARAQFQTAQVNFANAVRLRPLGEAHALLGDDFEHRRSWLGSVSSDPSDDVAIVSASMWSIAGWVVDPVTGQGHDVEMPFEDDPDVQQLKNLVRQRGSDYQFIWEWGRLAQDPPGEATALAAVLAAANYRDLKAVGGDLKNAWVVMHAAHPLNIRYYNSLFPNRMVYRQGRQALWVVPLAEAMAKYPIAPHSQRISKILDLVGDRLSSLQVIEFLQEEARIRQTHVNVKDHRRPFALHDFSAVSEFRRGELLRRFGLTGHPNQRKLLRFLQNDLKVAELSWNSGQYVDVADQQLTARFFADHHALEISNLDPRRALPRERPSLTMEVGDRAYVAGVLGSAISYLANEAIQFHARNSPVGQPPMSVNEAFQWLYAHDIRIGLSTHNPNVVAQGLALKPEVVHTFPTMPDAHVVDLYSMLRGGSGVRLGDVVPLTSMIFTAKQIANFWKTYPALHLGLRWEENGWARQLMLSDPEVF